MAGGEEEEDGEATAEVPERVASVKAKWGDKDTAEKKMMEC